MALFGTELIAVVLILALLNTDVSKFSIVYRAAPQ
jgi:hypothetical protein